MASGLVLVLGVLGTWRLARDYVNEEGPLGLYGWSRRALVAWAAAQIEASAVDNPHEHGWYWLYEGVACLVCVSFWAAAIIAVLVAWSRHCGVAAGLLLWWGLAGGALLVEKLYTHLGRA